MFREAASVPQAHVVRKLREAHQNLAAPPHAGGSKLKRGSHRCARASANGSVGVQAAPDSSQDISDAVSTSSTRRRRRAFAQHTLEAKLLAAYDRILQLEKQVSDLPAATASSNSSTNASNRTCECFDISSEADSSHQEPRDPLPLVDQGFAVHTSWGRWRKRRTVDTPHLPPIEPMPISDMPEGTGDCGLPPSVDLVWQRPSANDNVSNDTADPHNTVKCADDSDTNAASNAITNTSTSNHECLKGGMVAHVPLLASGAPALEASPGRTVALAVVANNASGTNTTDANAIADTTPFSTPLSDPLDATFQHLETAVPDAAHQQHASRTPAACVCSGRHRTNEFCHNVILQLPFGRWAYTDVPDAVLDFEFTPLDFDYLALLRDADYSRGEAPSESTVGQHM